MVQSQVEGPEVGHKVRICLRTRWILWWNCTYPGGSYPDINVGRGFVVYELKEGEMVLADSGYGDNGQYFIHLLERMTMWTK